MMLLHTSASPRLLLIAILSINTQPISASAEPSPPTTSTYNYRWLPIESQPLGGAKMDTIESRFEPPPGAVRRQVRMDGFEAWLRGLPLKHLGSPLLLHNGQLKPKQHLHEAVIDIDVGKANLQQCADAVIRFRAEYLYSRASEPDILFQYTTGDPISFRRWAKGERPRVREYEKDGKRRWRVDWVRGGSVGRNHKNFRHYLDNVFTYAGTASLARQLKRRSIENVQIGDLYLQGGHPGHAVLIVDIAHHPSYGKIALLAQSYMPAQEPHILKNVHNRKLSPWFQIAPSGRMYTPEWTFEAEDLYHF